MAKYSLTVHTDDIDDLQRMAVLAALVMYDDKDKYDYPPIDDASNALDWVLDQVLVIRDFAYENEELENLISFLECKIPAMRASLERMVNA